MNLSEHTSSLLSSIEQLAGGKITYKDRLGELLELAHAHHLEETLEQLSFHAKFADRSYRIMMRIGKDAEGYDKLATEFSASLETCKRYMMELLKQAPESLRIQFEAEFFALTSSALQHLLTFLYDLSWYKNHLIDAKKG